MEINKIVIDSLQKIEFINIIDIGCARGALMKEIVLPQRGKESVFSVGVDPLNHGVKRYYDHFLQVAVDNIGSSKFKIRKFYLNFDDQASSLLQMNYENLTDSLLDQERIYVPWKRRLGVRFTFPVLVINLETVIKRYFFNKKIHFLKIDAEGNDLNILKSQLFINRPLFISAEASNHPNPEIRLFKNGSQKKELVEFMKSMNYNVYQEANYGSIPNNQTQISDIIFKDRLDSYSA